MARKNTWLAGFPILLLAAACAAAQSGGSMAGALATDSRFHAKVTLAVRDEALGAFIDQFRTQTGSPVYAHPSTEDERISVFCRDQRAADVMAAVASLNDFSWRPAQRAGVRSYELVQLPDALKREETERSRLLDADLAAIRRAAEEQMALGKLSMEERQQAHVSEFRKSRETATDPALFRSIDRNLEAAQSGLFTVPPPYVESDAMAVALAAISPREWQSVWGGEDFRFAYPRDPGRASITEQQARDMVQLHLLTRGDRSAAGVNGYQNDVSVIRLRGEVTSRVEHQRLQLNFRCRYLARGPKGPRLGTITSLLTNRTLPARDDPMHLTGINSSDRAFQQPAAPLSAALDGKSQRIPDFLETLSRHVPYLLVSHIYHPSAPYGTRFLPEPTRTVSDWMNMECYYHSLYGRLEGSALIFRAKRWPLLRRIQLPSRASARWVAEIAARGLPRFDTLLEMGNAMTYPQGENLPFALTSAAGVQPSVVNWVRPAAQASKPALQILKILGPSGWAGLPSRGAAPRPIRDPRFAPILEQLLRRIGEEGSPGYPKEGAPDQLNAELQSEADLESGGPVGLRFYRVPMELIVGRLEMAAAEKRKDGRSGLVGVRDAAGARRLDGTLYVLELFPDPRAPRSMKFEFLTSDPPHS